MDSPVWVYLIGLLGMALYGSRILVQWYLSEKANRIVNPPSYWVMSSVGAIVLYIYGWLRKDFSIIFGESVSYYIYMWNISIMGMYKKLPRIVFWLQALFPAAIVAGMMMDWDAFSVSFFHNEDMPLMLLSFGILAQFTYEIRSVYQLVYSYRHNESALPLGHWVLAVIGSLMIIIYGILRHDWVLVIGQFAIVFSIRNIMLYFKWKHSLRKGSN
ncbi:MAG: lipid-A-disaccharide synthase N-terminal domain-containing protein [Bacteroidales bacterium]|nr:lipid-A-disaccharide synthase N-terminal domain-containing protein [Bacteroidales bacterium]